MKCYVLTYCYHITNLQGLHLLFICSSLVLLLPTDTHICAAVRRECLADIYDSISCAKNYLHVQVTKTSSSHSNHDSCPLAEKEVVR